MEAMTQENAKLIAQELGSRLSYGVKIRVNDKIETVEGINILDNIVEFGTYMACDIDEVKPYLFPMSSMTEEQIKEFNNITQKCSTYIGKSILLTDFCNKHHIDWREFIEKGLALDATGLNIY